MILWNIKKYSIFNEYDLPSVCFITSIILIFTGGILLCNDHFFDFVNSTVAIIALIISIYSFTTNFSYQKNIDECQQASKIACWVSDTSKEHLIKFTANNMSTAPVYNVYFILCNNDSIHNVSDYRIRSYQTLAPKQTTGSFLYDDVNEENKYSWYINYLFRDNNNRFWIRTNKGGLRRISESKYKQILRRYGIKPNYDYNGS